MRISLLLFLYIPFFLLLVSCGGPGNGSTEENLGTGEELKKDPLVELTETINSNSENDKLYIERAKYYLSINEIDSAFRDIFIAIDINNQDPGHFITLSDVYLVMGNPDKCKDALTKALKIKPNNKLAIQKLAELYLIVQDYDKTYETVNRALEVDNFNPVAYYIRGFALLEQADTLAAIDALKMAVYQDQDFYEAYLQLGLIFLARQNPLAAEYFNTAINIRPESLEPYYNLGLYYQENGQVQKAMSSYRMILEMQPLHTNAIYNLGYINLVYVQDFEAAVGFFTEVIEINPAYAGAFYNRGYAYEMLGQNNLAQEDYKKTLEIETNYTKAIEALNRLDR